jgi:outer membrane protein
MPQRKVYTGSEALMSPVAHRTEIGGRPASASLRRRGDGDLPARSRLLSVALAACVLLSTVAPAAAQTLTEALAYAYQTNPQLLAQRSLLRQTDEGVPQALSNWRPTVNFTGNTGYSNSSLTFFHPCPQPVDAYLIGESRCRSEYFNTRPSEVQLTMTQNVYRGGRTVAQTKQALDAINSTRAQTLSVETTVFQAVVQGFLDTVRDQNLLEVQINNEHVLRKQLEATEDRFKVGEVTRTDVAQAESQLAQATATRKTAEGQLQVSRAEYARAVGKEPGRLILPRERPVLPATREEALSLAANNNFSVISANFAELAARDNIKVVRGQLLPQVSVIGELGRNYDESTSFKGTAITTGTIEAQMTMPLYEGGAIYSQTRQAEQAVGQRRSQVDDARRAAVQSATQFWETLQSTRASIASFAAAVRAAQIALEGTQQEALVGSRTVLDVLIADQQLLTTQSQLVTAQHDAALAEYNLAAAIGRLVAPDLNLKVPLYDMEKHYKEIRNSWLGFAGGLKE